MKKEIRFLGIKINLHPTYLTIWINSKVGIGLFWTNSFNPCFGIVECGDNYHLTISLSSWIMIKVKK